MDGGSSTINCTLMHLHTQIYTESPVKWAAEAERELNFCILLHWIVLHGERTVFKLSVFSCSFRGSVEPWGHTGKANRSFPQEGSAGHVCVDGRPWLSSPCHLCKINSTGVQITDYSHYTVIIDTAGFILYFCYCQHIPWKHHSFLLKM